MVVLLAGGYWGDDSNNGSRTRTSNVGRSSGGTHDGCRVFKDKYFIYLR